MERDGYDWESGKRSITPDVFNDGSRCLSLLELHKLNDFMAVTFLNGCSSVEVLYINSKRHAVYAWGIECKHDAISKFSAKTLMLS